MRYAAILSGGITAGNYLATYRTPKETLILY